MAEDVVYQQWRNEAERSNYPFADWCVVPAGLSSIFADASLFFPADGPAYLSRISVSEEQVLVEVNQGGETATGSIVRGSSAEYIQLKSPSGFSRGVLVGRPGFLPLFVLPAGDTVFNRDQTEFVARVTTALPRDGVTSLRAGDEKFVGEVSIVAEGGVRFVPTAGGIMVDVVGIPATPAIGSKGSGVRSINLHTPDAAGVFRFVSCVIPQEAAPDSALRISSDENSVLFSLAGVT